MPLAYALVTHLHAIYFLVGINVLGLRSEWGQGVTVQLARFYEYGLWTLV